MIRVEVEVSVRRVFCWSRRNSRRLAGIELHRLTVAGGRDYMCIAYYAAKGIGAWQAILWCGSRGVTWEWRTSRRAR